MEIGIGDYLGARDQQINQGVRETVNLHKLATVLVGGALFAMTAVPAFADQGTDFVCPVFNSNAAVGDRNPNAVMIGGGDYTIVPSGAQHLSVPDHATNMGGSGSPGGTHASPGDTDYSAIWNSN